MSIETQLAITTQKTTQFERELAEKDGKWKSVLAEREAEWGKKSTDYKDRVSLDHFYRIDPKT